MKFAIHAFRGHDRQQGRGQVSLPARHHTARGSAAMREGDAAPANCHRGTTLDAFLAEEGIDDAAKAEASARVVAWRLGREPSCRPMNEDP